MRLRYHISQGLQNQLQFTLYRRSGIKDQKFLPSRSSIFPRPCPFCVRTYFVPSSRLRASHATDSKHVSDTDSDPIPETLDNQVAKAAIVPGVEAIIGYRFNDSSLCWKAICTSSNESLASLGKAALHFLLLSDLYRLEGGERELVFISPYFFYPINSTSGSKDHMPLRRTLEWLNSIQIHSGKEIV